MQAEQPIAHYRGVDVMVLGASGFIGRWVARALTQAGANLRLVVRDEQTARAVFKQYRVDGEIVVADLAEPATALPRLIETTAPRIVFNLLGYGVDRGERDPLTARAINAELPAVLCRLLTATPNSGWQGRRLVHAGSALEYGELRGNLSEQSTPNPTTVYGQTKLLGTEALRRSHDELGFATVVARLFTVYGLGEHEGRLLPSLLAAAHDRRALPLTAGLQERDFTYVEDVAEGLLRLGLVEKTDQCVVNLASGVLTSVRQFAETAAAELGIPLERLEFGAVPTRAEEMTHDPVSTARLQQMTGWKPAIDVRTGITLCRTPLREA